jgi:hypothetical protein
MLPLLMAGLISLKLSNYLFTIVPLFALAAAWGAAALWGRATGPAQLLWRGMLLLIFLVVALEGVTRLREMDRAAAETTPYRDFAAQLRRELPAGAAILGLHHYWFGLEGFTYRSWAVPLLLSAEAGGRSVDHYLSQYRPNAILVDSRMRDYFAANPVVEGEVRGWIAARGYRLAIVDDPTYGRFEIYRREP